MMQYPESSSEAAQARQVKPGSCRRVKPGCGQEEGAREARRKIWNAAGQGRAAGRGLGKWSLAAAKESAACLRRKKPSSSLACEWERQVTLKHKRLRNPGPSSPPVLSSDCPVMAWWPSFCIGASVWHAPVVLALSRRAHHPSCPVTVR